MNEEYKNKMIYKYLNQKEISFLEIIALLGIVVGIILFIIINRDTGLATIIVSTFLFVIMRTRKVKDSDFDDVLNELLRKNDIDITKDYIVTGCNYDSEYLKIGKDGKTRGSKYLIICFLRDYSGTIIDVYDVDLLMDTINANSFHFMENTIFKVNKEHYLKNGINKNVYYLNLNKKRFSLPLDNEQMSKIISNNIKYEID